MKKTSSVAISGEADPHAGMSDLDADAIRALAWLDTGRPQARIVYDAAVPRQTEDELAAFQPSTYTRKR